MSTNASPRIEPSPRVAVVVCAFNAERTISAAIASALQQSMGDVEVIVCDDASTDRTRDVVETLDDARIRLLVNARNEGPGRSRDRAIALATAEWVAFLDADDEWCPDRLSALLHVASQIDADVVFDDVLMCHDTPRGLTPFRVIHGHTAFGGRSGSIRQVPTEDFISSNRYLVKPMIRAAFLRAHDIGHSDRRFGEDAEYLLRLLVQGARFVYLSQPHYRYRISPGSLTAAANDPSAMRACIETCARWEGWSQTARSALDAKIQSLRTNEALYALLARISRGRLIQAVRVVLQHPQVLRILPTRAWNQLHYQVHRAWHGGQRR